MRRDVAVDGSEENANFTRRVLQPIALERRPPARNRRCGSLRPFEGIPLRARLRRRLAFEEIPRHLHDARERVADSVREVGVVAGEEVLVGEARVLPERHRRDEVPAERVHAERGDELVGPDDVARGLGHLPRVAQPPAVAHDLPRDAEAGRHEERGPVDGVEPQDVLPDDVDARPVALVERRVFRAEPERGDVVHERVEPDVDDVARAVRERDAPLDGRPGDREILEPGLHERAHLVEAALGIDERLPVGAFRPVQLEQAVAVP